MYSFPSITGRGNRRICPRTVRVLNNGAKRRTFRLKGQATRWMSPNEQWISISRCYNFVQPIPLSFPFFVIIFLSVIFDLRRRRRINEWTNSWGQEVRSPLGIYWNPKLVRLKEALSSRSTIHETRRSFRKRERKKAPSFVLCQCRGFIGITLPRQ